MFRGINSVNLDEKGRIGIPTRYRARLQEEAAGRLVVTIDTEEACLLLYPTPEWEVIAQKLEKLPSFNKTARRIQRLLIGHAADIEMDSSGRILLPPYLREHADLKKNCALVGQGNRFEIWPEEGWQERCKTWVNESSIDGQNLPGEWADLSL